LKGTILGDRYELLDKIGEGGMSIVYKARCRILDRIVAVKILKDEYSNNGSFVEKFKTEALAAAQLSHPNIVNIFDVGDQDNIYFIVMEYVEGRTLKEIICEKAPLSVEEAMDITIMICDGIHHAHEKGIIHRDIKPHNILITDSGIVKVADFGIAQAINQKTITYGGNIVGSVYYISPEQAKGEPVSRASDIYSLGCVLYEMLTARTPFDAESPITVALKHIHDEPVPPRTFNEDIPASLEGIILRAMERKPGYRFSTAEEMRNTLLNLYNVSSKYSHKHRDNNTIVISPISTEGVENGVKKRKIRPSGIAIVLIAFLGLLSGFLFVMGSSLFGEEIVVPDIVGMDIKNANRELGKLGLEMTVIAKQFSNEIEKDKIISQDPSTGQKVKEGREIKVILSNGTELQKVPIVVGLKLADARIRLTNEGLKIGGVEEIYDDKYEEDFIISQDPQAGEQVEKGSSIDLMVSKGKAPERVSMPDLIGLNLEEARQRLQDNNLLLGEQKREESSEYYTGQVMEQDTEAGVLIDQQSSISIVVSKGPGPAAKTKTLEFKLPKKQDYYKVIINLKDAQREREIYNELHKAADTVYVGVNYFGSAKVEVKLNGQLYKIYNY